LIDVTTTDVAWYAAESAGTDGIVRRATTDVAAEVGFDEPSIAELALVATELSSNLRKHAAEGQVVVRVVRTPAVVGIELVALDRGPGIADVERALGDGHSTTGTLGIGLGAVLRLSSTFDIFSRPGSGTVAVARRWRSDPGPVATHYGALTRPITGEKVCGDAVAVRSEGARTVALVVDGLGHGPLAASASQAAVHRFGEVELRSPLEILQALHPALNHTRGAAAAVVDVDPARPDIRLAGVGNIAAFCDDGQQRRGLMSYPGILGGQVRTFREVSQPCAPGTLVVLHSDGVSEKWDLAGYPGLRRQPPTVVAATLLRDFGIRRDDASVLVIRPAWPERTVRPAGPERTTRAT
jgi:anti-sigma regulatory factor (Ser/Thr protein kinase)